MYDGLKDAAPDSSFVMLQNAEHMEEIYRPLSVPSVSDVLTAEKIVERNLWAVWLVSTHHQRISLH